MQGATPSSLALAPEALRRYRDEGVVRIENAVPAADVAALAEVVWRRLRERHGIVAGGSERWAVSHPAQLTDKADDLAPMASPTLRAAFDQLLGAGGWARPERWGLPLVTGPRAAARWDVPHKGWHLDLTAGADRGPSVRVFVLLADHAPEGGATGYVAGSHRVVRALVEDVGRPMKSDPIRKLLVEREPWFAALFSAEDRGDRQRRFMREPGQAAGVPVRVGEMTGKAGDAYLMDPLTLHAMTPNTGGAARIMLTEWIYGRA